MLYRKGDVPKGQRFWWIMMSGLSPSLSFPHPVFELFPCAHKCWKIPCITIDTLTIMFVRIGSKSKLTLKKQTRRFNQHLYARPCIISSSSMQGKPFLFSPKVPQNNQFGLVEVSAFTKLFSGCGYALEILAHSFSLLHLIKLLSLLPNHRSHPRPKFTKLPLLRHLSNAP